MATPDVSEVKIGPGAAASVAAETPDKTEPAGVVEPSLWANWPFVAVFIVCAGTAETVRQRRRENQWRNQCPAEGPLVPLVPAAIDASEPSFKQITVLEMMQFARPSVAALAVGPNVPDLREPASWHIPREMHTNRHDASSRA